MKPMQLNHKQAKCQKNEFCNFLEGSHLNKSGSENHIAPWGLFFWYDIS